MIYLILSYLFMFDIIDPDLFTDCVQEHFSVLDRRYVEDQSKELHAALRATFDAAYETRFLILDRETCKPLNVNAVLANYDAAEEFIKILGDEKYITGFLLIDR